MINEPKKRKKPGPKPRSAAMMTSAEQATHDAHRTEERTDHGRKAAQPSRISITSSRRLDNVESEIPAKHRGKFIKPDEIDRYVEGGYVAVTSKASGDPIVRAGKGVPLHLYSIPIDYFKEDQAARRKRSLEALGESVTIDEGKDEYTPNANGRAVVGTVSDDPFRF